jgi:hypothetical protein
LLKKILICGEFNNTHALIYFKINLFRIRELLENHRKCSGLEKFDVYTNFENSECVNTEVGPCQS